MTPLLFNAPTDVGMWLTFGSVHQSDHFEIVQQILSKQQVLLPMLPLDPIPLDNEIMMITWFEIHQMLHEQMNTAVNVSGSDLSYVDFRDEVSTTYWIQNHAQEHTQISAALAAMHVT